MVRLEMEQLRLDGLSLKARAERLGHKGSGLMTQAQRLELEGLDSKA